MSDTATATTTPETLEVSPKDREWAIRQIQVRLTQHRLYDKAHTTEKRAYMQKYELEHAQERKDYHSKHNQEHKKEIQQYMKQNHKEHREEHLRYGREHYIAHREELLENSRKYFLEHPEAHSKANHNRRALLANAPGTLTKKDIKKCLEDHQNKCYYCNSTEHLTIDHLVPLSRGGSNTPDNIVPACKACNSRKGTLTAGEFFKRITNDTREVIQSEPATVRT